MQRWGTWLTTYLLGGAVKCQALTIVEISKGLQRLDGPSWHVPLDPLHHAAHEKHSDKNQQKRLRLQPADRFVNVVFEEFLCLKSKAPRPLSGEPFYFVLNRSGS
jgi:hypothetical protein